MTAFAFRIKIYFISHLHPCSGPETSIVNAVNNLKNKSLHLIKMTLQSELLISFIKVLVRVSCILLVLSVILVLSKKERRPAK